ncbi:hypothetical protein J7I98_35950 [Streptomyces sp. ISL-98]|uniref:hypothetical protein n=1 Tax=Streptomyces sp. ISL-98 TaxID=2819192 RepID=UPI001BE96E32|nr:hypothetical protein [Streptomyces sp. ISL-98]MBT2511120.1 hypothetical protein [Streptomyces sp. ISL-98]
MTGTTMTAQQQNRPIETVGFPRPTKPDYTTVFLEPALSNLPEVESEDEDDHSTFR